MRFKRKSQFAKLGSISTFKSLNWTRNEAWPIQVTATWPRVSLGKFGRLCWPVRGVNSAFHTISFSALAALTAGGSYGAPPVYTAPPAVIQTAPVVQLAPLACAAPVYVQPTLVYAPRVAVYAPPVYVAPAPFCFPPPVFHIGI